MARTMISEIDLPKYFWGKAVNTTCYMLNRTLIRPILKKTPYELVYGRPSNIAYFKVFGCKCIILNVKDNLEKFNKKWDKRNFLRLFIY